MTQVKQSKPRVQKEQKHTPYRDDITPSQNCLSSLHENIYMQVTGTHTYLHIQDGVIENALYNKNIRSNKDIPYDKIFPFCPLVIKWYNIKSDNPDNRKLYIIQINDDINNCNERELKDGSVWSKFSCDLGTEGQSNIAMLANVVKFVAYISSLPLDGFSTVGWNVTQHNGIKKKRYILDDGRGLNGDEFYILNTSEKILEHALQRTPMLPLPNISLEDATKLWEWIYTASSKGHAAISYALRFRSYLYDIVPSLVSFLLYSKDSTPQNATRLGKTLIQKNTNNLTIRTYYQDALQATFRDTISSIEDSLARQQSSNMVVDDMNFPPHLTIGKQSDIANKLEMLGRSSSETDKIKGRQQRNMQRATNNYVRTIPFINGEKVPPVLTSLTRRMIAIPIDIGDVNIQMYKDAWEHIPTMPRWSSGYAYDLMRLGHMALRNIEQARNDNEISFYEEIKRYEQDIIKRLHSDLEAKNVKITNNCEDMPINYTFIISGMWLLGKYAFNEIVGIQWSNDIYPYVLTWLIQQINSMQGTAINNELLESILTAIRSNFLTQHWYIRDNKDNIFTGNNQTLPVKPYQCGYKVYEHKNHAPEIGKIKIGNTVKSDSCIAFTDKGIFYAGILQWLRQQGIISTQKEIFDTLVNAGIFLPFSGRYQGTKERVNNKVNAYLVIPFDKLWEYPIDDEMCSNSSNSSNNGYTSACHADLSSVATVATFDNGVATVATGIDQHLELGYKDVATVATVATEKQFLLDEIGEDDIM